MPAVLTAAVRVRCNRSQQAHLQGKCCPEGPPCCLQGRPESRRPCPSELPCPADSAGSASGWEALAQPAPDESMLCTAVVCRHTCGDDGVLRVLHAVCRAAKAASRVDGPVPWSCLPLLTLLALHQAGRHWRSLPLWQHVPGRCQAALGVHLPWRDDEVRLSLRGPAAQPRYWDTFCSGSACKGMGDPREQPAAPAVTDAYSKQAEGTLQSCRRHNATERCLSGGGLPYWAHLLRTGEALAARSRLAEGSRSGRLGSGVALRGAAETAAVRYASRTGCLAHMMLHKAAASGTGCWTQV